LKVVVGLCGHHDNPQRQQHQPHQPAGDGTGNSGECEPPPPPPYVYSETQLQALTMRYYVNIVGVVLRCASASVCSLSSARLSPRSARWSPRLFEALF
jgi:hypothetical protein